MLVQIWHSLTICLSVLSAQESSEIASRSQFARAMSRIETGLTRQDVLRQLGTPDVIRRGVPHPSPLAVLGGEKRVRTQDVDTTASFIGVHEIWHYGVHGENGFPTLGRVYFEAGNNAEASVLTVAHVYGAGEPSPKIRTMNEDDLRQLISVLGTPIDLHAYYFDPAAVVSTVNVLQPLGKESALAVIDEYLRVCPETHAGVAEKLMLVLRVLFDVPETGHMPEFQLGTQPQPPRDRNLIPRFPVHVVDDIPLLVVHGVSSQGGPPSTDRDLEYFRSKGRLRSRRLVPGPRPLSALEHLQGSPAGNYAVVTEEARGRIIVQLLTMLNSVMPTRNNFATRKLANDLSSLDNWERFVADFERNLIRWDGEQNQYRRCLPDQSE